MNELLVTKRWIHIDCFIYRNLYLYKKQKEPMNAKLIVIFYHGFAYVMKASVDT